MYFNDDAILCNTPTPISKAEGDLTQTSPSTADLCTEK